MEITYPRCAGLDIHKKTVVACAITVDAVGEIHQETRTFTTMTDDVLVLADWLTTQGVTHVAMESTGELWKPIYNILEGTCDVLVVNAAHIKAVPGRRPMWPTRRGSRTCCATVYCGGASSHPCLNGTYGIWSASG